MNYAYVGLTVFFCVSVFVACIRAAWLFGRSSITQERLAKLAYEERHAGLIRTMAEKAAADQERRRKILETLPIGQAIEIDGFIMTRTEPKE